MFKDLMLVIRDYLIRVIKSRMFPIVLILCIAFIALVARLYQLQIIEQADHQQDYIQKTLTTVTLKAARGNIYDRNGVLLAYNELSYSVTLIDNGTYIKNAAKNQMIYELLQLLDQYDTDISISLPISYTEDGGFTITSETQKNRLLRDIYGLSSTSELDDAEGKYPSNLTPLEIIALLKEYFYFDTWTDADGNSMEVSDYDAYRIVNIRWELKENEYKKYQSITIAADVSEECQAAVLEQAANYSGVDVEEDYVRVYPDGEYFAHIIGYTGKASSDELEELQAEDDSYENGDIVGKSGIEAVMEQELSGTKGSQTMYKDSTGNILEIVSVTEPEIGQDVYLTIDHDLQIATYNLLEQTLAGILADKIVNEDIDPDNNADLNISIKEVFYQLFSNNVLSFSDMGEADASDAEASIYTTVSSQMNTVLDFLNQQLTQSDPAAYNSFDEDMQGYMDFAYTYLVEETGLIDESLIDTTNEVYLAWKDGSTSLRAFIYEAILQQWVVTENLGISDKYAESDEIYAYITDELLLDLQEDEVFSSFIIESLINQNLLSGNLICMALYDQDVLDADSATYMALSTASSETVYNFMIDCILSLQITPSQLALDPCTGSTVITDVNTGDVLALVSYPGYDNNLFSGSIDGDYYAQLVADQSNPLFNYATQSRTSPGSTYKMLTAIAALEDGVVTPEEYINCTGIYEKVDNHPKCWIYETTHAGHGLLNLTGALANSCNYYFYEMGYRLSSEENQTYNETLGISRLAYYAQLLGLDSVSGIELNEYAPQISTQYPVASAIGQGTNNYTTVQMAKYVSIIANGGTAYDLTLLDSVRTSDGTIVKSYDSVGTKITEISDETWKLVQEGMRDVITEGTVKTIFADTEVEIAGKTGSAQEDKTRGNHALFVSYAPYDDPEISVTTTIRNGYTSAHTASLANEIYNYYYGYTTLDEILENDALSGNQPNVID